MTSGHKKEAFCGLHLPGRPPRPTSCGAGSRSLIRLLVRHCCLLEESSRRPKSERVSEGLEDSESKSYVTIAVCF